jgi:hypothetical protein
MELFVDDLVECHGDVRVRAMMVLCCELAFGSVSSSSIYCDTLSVSQYDSKVRSDLNLLALQGLHVKSLNNLFELSEI